MTNSEIAGVLEQVADLLEFQAANPFRIRAYRNGARTVRELPEQVTTLLGDPERKLTDIGGIGKDLAVKILTLVQTGRLPMLDELLEQIPRSVLSLLRVPGLGPKKAALLFRALGVTTLDQLRDACLAGSVRQLKGLGAKTEQTILAGLDLAVRAGERITWAEADVIAQELIAHLQPVRSARRMALAGSYRRHRDTVGDLDLLVEATRSDPVMDRFATFSSGAQVLLRGTTKMTVRLEGGLQIDLRVVPGDSFGAALQYFTGSKEHNVVLRGRARQRGLKISEWGVFRAGDGEPDERIAGATEEEVYGALELPLIPPELREARQEFDWATAGALPDLVELADLRGDLHMHTRESDGRADVEAMVAAARARGWTYIAITDHSKRVAMARGLDGQRLRQQWARIDRLNRSLTGFKVLKGVECDILEQGGMDLPDDVLAEADWVVASVHYGQNQSRAQITQRIVGALAHPHVAAIAHPTGRLIQRRKAYEVDLDAVFRAAVEHRKMLELNANPARLDLDDVACAAARRHGIPVVISTDAHHPEGLDVMRFGVFQARRGGLTRTDVANTRSWPELKKLLGRR